MYCINCGVKLADTEKVCPLCNTAVYHPDIEFTPAPPLYPPGRIPKTKPRSKTFNGVILILFFIPLFVSLLADMQTDGALSWFGYVAGALLFSYILVALPLWFNRPNPVVFVPCDFAAAALYLCYINYATGGAWFWSFALPLTAGLCIIITTLVTLLRYLHKGKLYIFGGTLIALGAFMLLMEFLLNITFSPSFIGWSVYPLIVFVLLGGALIYLAINSTAREIMERKLFF